MMLLEPNRYPANLTQAGLDALPLWCDGQLDVLGLPMAAVVGTRDVSEDGVRKTAQLTGALAEAGFCIVSGMARGVDCIAHEVALHLGVPTLAVMGTAIEQCYPKEHRDLKERIKRSGLLLSQFPPGSRVHRSFFPKRNEVMAALCDITFIVEASEESGTRHQVKAAAKFNRPIGFLPQLLRSRYDWVVKSLESGGGHPIKSRADVFSLLRTLRGSQTELCRQLEEESFNVQRQSLAAKVGAIQQELDIVLEFDPFAAPPKPLLPRSVLTDGSRNSDGRQQWLLPIAE